MHPALIVLLVALGMLALANVAVNHLARRQFTRKTANVAFLDMASISGTLTGILKVIIVLSILGATVGLLFTSIADIVSAITTESTNNTTADLLRPVFGLIVALAGLFLIVRKVLDAAK